MLDVASRESAVAAVHDSTSAAESVGARRRDVSPSPPPRRLRGPVFVGRTDPGCCTSSPVVVAAASLFPPHLLLPLLLLLAVVGPQTTSAEVVFHRRDHRDQGDYVSNQPSYHVHSYTDALQYLQKYGYLTNCTVHTTAHPPHHSLSSHRSGRRRRRSSSSSSNNNNNNNRKSFSSSLSVDEGVAVPSSVAAGRDCTDVDVRVALRRLQRRFDLRPSGRLDDDTRSLMSRGRCGNTDAEDKRAQLKPEPETVSRSGGGGGERKTGSRRRHRRNAESRTSDGVMPRRTRRTAEAENSSVNDASQGTSGSQQQVQQRRNQLGIDHASLRQRIVPEVVVNVPGTAYRRRQRQLQEIRERLYRDLQAPTPESAVAGNVTDEETLLALERIRRGRRERRSISVLSIDDQIIEGPAVLQSGPGSDDRTRFQKDENRPIQWRLLDDGVSGKIPLMDQRAILELAFRMWSEVIPLKFNEAKALAMKDMDVVIAFAKQNHMNCDKPFDGHGGELAHSWTGGDIHFDEDENYKRDDPTGTGINLLKVAVHEIGHVLGLLHNDRDDSIMYPIYINTEMYDDFELCRDDRKAVQSIYGICKGSFDVVFDWLRKVRSADGLGTRYIFNTYFFRGPRYWMYENRFNRTRFGDPLYVEREWTGLPRIVDAYVQILAPSGDEYAIDTYFFSGDSYYKYDDDTDRVAPGFPRKIAADFGSKVNGTDVIPNNLDAVLFDNRDSMMYFFKDDWVWIYNSREVGNNACCESKVAFSTLFPTAAAEPNHSSSSTNSSTAASSDPDNTSSSGSGSVSVGEKLTGNIDAVFYSYHFHKMFFFQGETVYVNVAYDERAAGSNLLQRRGSWYDIWLDICDVE